eukprot:2420151-Pleurochrysis_carterae.AAC.1
MATPCHVYSLAQGEARRVGVLCGREHRREQREERLDEADGNAVDAQDALGPDKIEQLLDEAREERAQQLGGGGMAPREVRLHELLPRQIVLRNVDHATARDRCRRRVAQVVDLRRKHGAANFVGSGAQCAALKVNKPFSSTISYNFLLAFQIKVLTCREVYTLICQVRVWHSKVGENKGNGDTVPTHLYKQSDVRAQHGDALVVGKCEDAAVIHDRIEVLDPPLIDRAVNDEPRKVLAVVVGLSPELREDTLVPLVGRAADGAEEVGARHGLWVEPHLAVRGADGCRSVGPRRRV